jgi:alanine dehydrogenase
MEYFEKDREMAKKIAEAVKAAVGIDAQVTLLDINLNRLAYLEDIFGASVTTLYSTEANIRKALAEADLGLEEALKKDVGLVNGVNICKGKCTNKNVADSLQLEYTDVFEALA